MTSGKTICYSGAPSKNTQHRLGTPHYSYRFAEQKFLSCFAGLRIDAYFMAMPEYFSAPMSYSMLPTYEGTHIHIIFRSTEEIRILKSAYNIVCYAWEFPYIKDTTLEGEHPFLNQKRMLKLCDEIWVPCEYTKAVLDVHGLENVHVVPAPIADRKGPDCQRTDVLARLGCISAQPLIVNFLGNGSLGRGSRSLPLYTAFTARGLVLDRKVYLSIFNPEDFRKNLDGLVRGFDLFQQRSGRNDLLIIKALTSTDRFDLKQVVCDVILHKLEPGSAIDNRNILVINALLSSEDLTLLYELADFYVCTSMAEGQNLPLQEAMMQGVVPVTTRNTAMLDYVDIDNAVVIATERRRNSCEHLAGNIAGKPYDVEVCTAKQVAYALDTASTLNEKTYWQMSKAARTRILDQYSQEVIGSLIAARLGAIGGAGLGATGERNASTAQAGSTAAISEESYALQSVGNGRSRR